MKVGVIRCMQTEDFCAGTNCFKMIANKTGSFEGTTEDIEIIGYVNCGGCPGKKAVLRTRKLLSMGVDTIAMASCITKGNPIGYPCPFMAKMRDLIKNECADKNIRILEYTH